MHHYHFIKHAGLLREYEDVVIGKRLRFSDVYFNDNKEYNRKNALIVMRYAFDRYLRWPPSVISQRMTMELMEKLHLKELLKYVEYPVEFDKETSFFYLVSIIYLHKEIGRKTRIIHLYNQICQNDDVKFPKAYFDGADGIARACICLRYAINQNLTFPSINDMYSYFASQEGYLFLKDHALLPPCQLLFETPVDYLHEAAPDHLKSNIYRSIYKCYYMLNILDVNGVKKKISISKKGYKRYKLKEEEEIL